MLLSIPNYTLDVLLYEGVHTDVYRGRRISDNFPVIIKILKEEHSDPKLISQLEHEFSVTRKLNSPHIVQAYSLEPFQERRFLVMEDFSGEPLSGVIPKIDLKIFLNIAIELAQGLGEIHHQNIIHKDIKPHNIIINSNSTQVKITDFGIAISLSREIQQVASPETLEGTIAYVSPEQTGRMNRAVDYRTDIYSLGITLYEMITHRLPFTSNDFMEIVYAHIAKKPTPPHEIDVHIPKAISDIIMKCLAKNAEDRYQSAYGIKNDLVRCLEQFNASGTISEFAPGQQDLFDQFTIPQKLYGRENEIDFLLEIFERSCHGNTEILFVTGSAGIGKSTLIQEVQKPIIEKHGRFIAGKFDQFKKNIPYHALIQAFQRLIQQLLSESDIELAKWKQRILKAVGVNGQLLIDLFPELELIIGKQSAVIKLDPELSENRFNHLFSNFISLFLHKGHPLIIFLDDLQWADLSSLRFLQYLMSQSYHYLLLICAYRENEIEIGHPLLTLKKTLETSNANINSLSLKPLDVDAIRLLIGDAFHSPEKDVDELAKLTFQKTQGNPFFITQFLKLLYQNNLLKFDPNKQTWIGNLQEINQLEVTDNVADLMIAKIKQQNPQSQLLLKYASAIGRSFDKYLLAEVCNLQLNETEAALLPLLQEEFIFLSHSSSDVNSYKRQRTNTKSANVQYSFQHDRIQQAAYELISKHELPAVHLKIGRALLKSAKQTQHEEEQLLSIVNQMNEGIPLITSEEERESLATLNLKAGIKTQEALSYKIAEQYFFTGIKLLKKNNWNEQYSLSFLLYSHLSECQVLTGNYLEAETTFYFVLQQAKTLLEKVEIYSALMGMLSSIGKHEESLKLGNEALQLLGNPLKFPIQFTELIFEWLRMKFNFRFYGMDYLIKLPPVKNEQIKLLSEIYHRLEYSTGTIKGPFALAMVILKEINLAFRTGLTENSASAIMFLAVFVTGERVHLYREGVHLASSIMKTIHYFPKAIRNNQHVESNYLAIASFWDSHFKSHLVRLKNLGQECLEVGNIVTMIYCNFITSVIFMLSGDNLNIVLKELKAIHLNISKYKTFLIPTQQLFIDYCEALLGQTTDPTNFSIQSQNQASQKPLETNKTTSITVVESYLNYVFYRALRVFLLYLHGKFEEAVVLSEEINSPDYLWVGAGYPIWQQCHFAVALSLAALCSRPLADLAHWKKLKDYQKRSKMWANACPINYLHKHLLINAEVERLAGNFEEAIKCYEQSITIAETNGFSYDAAIAYETAALFYLSQGKPRLASTYMQEAYYGYVRWGAVSKSKQLAEKYAELLNNIEPSELTTRDSDNTKILGIGDNISNSVHTSNTSLDAFDLTAIMQASQTISGELVLNKLLEKLMQIVMINAGAERSFLILVENDVLLVQAEISIEKKKSILLQKIPLYEKQEKLSIAIVQYVTRTKKELLLNDAVNEGNFINDPYIKRRNIRSLLCLPLITKDKLIGILYLENNLITGAFTQDRSQLLTMLSSQIAISIETARLYANLESEVEKRTAELKQTQDRLIQQEKMASLGLLTAAIAHEIKNPLNFVINFSQLAVNELSDLNKTLELHRIEYAKQDNEAIQENIESLKSNLTTVSEQGVRTDKIVKKMLEHASGREGDAVPTDIHALLEDAFIESSQHFSSKHHFQVEVERNLDSKIGIIKIKAKEIRRVFLALFNNAFEALLQRAQETPSSFHPLIKITTHDQGSKCEIRIRDNGKGISSTIKDKIFTPFFTTKPGSNWIGLGLSLSHNIVVQQHGGDMFFESVENQFTEFVIKLPK